MLVLKCPRSEKGSQSIFTSWWKCDWKYVLNYCYSCLANRYASKSLLQFCGASWSALSFLVFFIRASHATLTAPRNSQILKLRSPEPFSGRFQVSCWQNCHKLPILIIFFFSHRLLVFTARYPFAPPGMRCWDAETNLSLTFISSGKQAYAHQTWGNLDPKPILQTELWSQEALDSQVWTKKSVWNLSNWVLFQTDLSTKDVLTWGLPCVESMA